MHKNDSNKKIPYLQAKSIFMAFFDLAGTYILHRVIEINFPKIDFKRRRTACFQGSFLDWEIKIGHRLISRGGEQLVSRDLFLIGKSKLDIKCLIFICMLRQMISNFRCLEYHTLQENMFYSENTKTKMQKIVNTKKTLL